MKITKWVEFSDEVEVDVGIEDIRAALSESFAQLTRDRLGEPGPNRNDVVIVMNSIAGFLNALTDEHIAMLLPAQKDTIGKFLATAASRFK